MQADEGKVIEAIKVAIGAGYRHIDGAYVYENEKEVGAGIHAMIDQGAVKREELFVVSKVMFTGTNQNTPNMTTDTKCLMVIKVCICFFVVMVHLPPSSSGEGSLREDAQ